VLVASVLAGDAEKTVSTRLRSAGCRVWFARSRGELDGLKSAYTQPEALGVDRWLAMLGGLQRKRGAPFCVVDAGSALTIDFVDGGGAHLGGYILPGEALMERCLFENTGRVRFDAIDDSGALTPGRSTAEAVRGGLRLAQAGAVREALRLVRDKLPEPSVLLTGGGARNLADALHGESELLPELVFEGLLRQARAEGISVPDVPPGCADVAEADRGPRKAGEGIAR
jgi:type III pantothenate kinase